MSESPSEAARETAGNARSGASSESPFPKLRSIERGALLGFVIGNLALATTFGLRTAFFQPDYHPEPAQLALLGIQGVAEILVSLSVCALALWIRRAGLSKTLLVVCAAALVLVKGFLLMAYVTLGEPNPWVLSPGTMALCALVSVPVWITFFPVLAAIRAARGARAPTTEGASRDAAQASPPAMDSPLEVRAALVVWLATVGLGTFVLGPDWPVRLWGSLVIGAAAAHLGIGLAEERRLVQWARQAIKQGPPAYVLQEEPPPAEAPSVFAADERKATLYAASEEAGSYRTGPAKKVFAAVDPVVSRAPRRFGKRVTARLTIPLVYTTMAVALSWPLLHSSEMPPRAVSAMYSHYPIAPHTGHQIEGLTLWSVRRMEGEHTLVGYDPETREVIDGERLFRRVRGVSLTDLADLANMMLYDGRFPIQRNTATSPKDESGADPTAPFLDDGRLVFWRVGPTQSIRTEAPYEQGMLAEGKGK